MQRIKFNFATQPHRREKVYFFIFLIMFFLLTGITILNIYSFRNTYLHRKRLKTHISNLTNEILSLSRTRSDKTDSLIYLFKEKEKEIDFANTLLMESAFSWTKFLNELEYCIPQGIAITHIEPELTTTTITKINSPDTLVVKTRITGEARSLDTMMKFVQDLKKENKFSDVSIIKYINKNYDDVEMIEFEIEVKYCSTNILLKDIN